MLPANAKHNTLRNTLTNGREQIFAGLHISTQTLHPSNTAIDHPSSPYQLIKTPYHCSVGVPSIVTLILVFLPMTPPPKMPRRLQRSQSNPMTARLKHINLRLCAPDTIYPTSAHDPSRCCR